LIEKQEREKKRRAGLDGTSRGRVAAGIDAVGAAMGTLGLIAFAILIWRFLPSHSSPAILTIAGLAWLAISGLAWRIRKAMKKLKAARRRKVTIRPSVSE
jgi:threonine/homoserine/homoserine lactone efflux protein